MTDMDMNEMMAAIARACADNRPDIPDDPGATREEMAAYWGVSTAEAGRRLTRSVKLGKNVRGVRWVQNEHGTWRKVPVYRAA